MSLNRDADDPYDILGLAREATEDEVKKRARKLLDKYDGDLAARTAINDAFESIQERPGPVEVNGTMVVPLLVSATPGNVKVNEEVTVRVTNHADDAVSGAKLRREDDGKRVGRTDDDGKETVRFWDHGTHTIVASKESHPKPNHQYRDGEVAVRVKESDG